MAKLLIATIHLLECFMVCGYLPLQLHSMQLADECIGQLLSAKEKHHITLQSVNLFHSVGFSSNGISWLYIVTIHAA